MQAKEPKRPSASPVISMIALFVAISGVATAANKSSVKIPANSVGSAQLKPGAVQKTDIGKAAVTVAAVAPAAITPTALAQDAVTPAALAPSAVTSTKIAKDAVDTTKIAPNAVVASSLAPGSITPPSLAASAVGAAALAPNAVTASAIGPSAVTPSAIAPSAITAPAIAPSAVTGEKIAAAAVTKPKIGDGAVDTDQIAPEAVKASTIAPKAVTITKMDTTPGAKVTTGSQAMNQSFATCFLKDQVSFDTVEWNRSSAYSVANPERLTAPVSGQYSVTAGTSWANGGGAVRIMGIDRHFGPGSINNGQHSIVQSVNGTPAATGTTDLALTTTLNLTADDYITLQAATCGANVSLANANVAMNWAGPSS